MRASFQIYQWGLLMLLEMVLTSSSSDFCLRRTTVQWCSFLIISTYPCLLVFTQLDPECITVPQTLMLSSNMSPKFTHNEETAKTPNFLGVCR